MAEESFTAWKTWLTSIFNEMFRLMHNQERDNFDNFRYPEEHRSSFFYDVHARYLSFLVENADALWARHLLEDQVSRDLFDKLILFRLLGHMHVRLPVKNREVLHGRTLPSEWRSMIRRMQECSDLFPFSRCPTTGRKSDQGWGNECRCHVPERSVLFRPRRRSPCLRARPAGPS